MTNPVRTIGKVEAYLKSRRDKVPMVVRCMDCEWLLEAPAAEAIRLAREHRGQNHPQRPEYTLTKGKKWKAN